jgi:hypothetical protein
MNVVIYMTGGPSESHMHRLQIILVTAKKQRKHPGAKTWKKYFKLKDLDGAGTARSISFFLMV